MKTSRGRSARQHRPHVLALEPRTLLAATLLADINPQPTYPSNLADVGGVAYFMASDGGGGVNLMKSDGTPGGSTLVSPLGLAYTPRTIVDLGGKPVFQAGDELGTVDPATGKVVMIANYDGGAFNGGDQGRYPFQLTVAGGHVYYEVLRDPSAKTMSIDVTDGTPGVTTRLYNGADTQTDGSPTMAALGSSLIFGVNDPALGPELWVSDGTADGTRVLEDLKIGPAFSGPKDFVSDGNRVFFLTTDPANSQSTLWVSDGTVAGTKSLYTSSTHLFLDIQEAGHGRVFARLFNFGLLSSDGTVAGTTEIPVSPDVDPDMAFLDDGAAVFTAGDTLWRSDGTVAGTVALRSISIRPLNQNATPPLAIASAGGLAYFAAWDAAAGTELWKTDGTAAGTGRVADIMPGPAGSDPADLTAVGSRVFFAARDPQGENELWSSDGSAAGTTRAAILPNPVNGDSNASLFRQNGYEAAMTSGAITYFLATDPDHGVTLWRTDGTTAGTFALPEQVLGPGDDSIQAMTPWSGGLAYIINDSAGGSSLYTSDGTVAGTKLAVDLKGLGLGYDFYSTTAMATLGGRIYYLGADGTSLIGSDGTPGGTQVVATATNGFEFSGLVTSGDRLYFTTTTNPLTSAPTHVTQLWTSDGTQAGTVPLAAIGSNTYAADLTISWTFGNLFYFVDQGADFSVDLWRTDGTPGGTFLVKSLPNAKNDFSSISLAAHGSTVYFGADDGSGRLQVFRTDGTASGTALALDLGPRDSSGITSLIGHGGFLWFEVPYGAAAGIYRSDGTQAGTARVIAASDVGGSPSAGSFGPLIDLGSGVAFFAGQSGDAFRTDGTAAGTVELAQTYLDPRYEGTRLLPSGDILTFSGNTGRGVEPTRIDTSASSNHPPRIGLIADQVVGQGGRSTLTATATDPDAGQSIAFSLAPNAPAGATINPTTGTFSWGVPGDLRLGDYSIGIVATDSGSPAASTVRRFTVTVGPPDGAPRLGFVPNLFVAAGGTLDFGVNAVQDTPRGTLHFSLDPGAPAGATIDPATGAFRYTPIGTSKTVSVTIRVTDSGSPGTSSARSFSITQTGLTPLVDLGGDVTLTLPAPLSKMGRVTDPYGLPLAAQVDYGDGSLPQMLAIATDGSFALNHGFAKAGNYTVRVTAIDPRGHVNAATIAVVVAATPVIVVIPPVLPIPAATVRKGSIASLVVRFTGDVSGAALSSSYQLVQLIPRGRKTIARAVKIKSVYYDASTHSATIVPLARLPKSVLLRLTIVSSAIRDAEGRAINGGSNAIFTIRKGIVAST